MRGGYSEVDGIYRSLRTPIQMPNKDTDLASFLFAGKAGHPSVAQKPALIDSSSGDVITFSELLNQSNQIAAGLWELGLRQHDVVLILLGNSLTYPLIFLGTVSIGAVVTTANPICTKQEIFKQLKDSKASLIITNVEFLEKIEGAGVPLVLLGDTSENDFTRIRAADHENGSVTPFSKLLDVPAEFKPPVVEVRLTDTAALLYSSGTTGLSKGVILTHENFIAACLQVDSVHNESAALETDTDIMLSMLPMFHCYGLVMACSELRRAFSLVIMPKYTFASLLEATQRFRVTHIPVVPPILVSLGKHNLALQYDLSSLKELSSGGAPLGWETVKAVFERLPNCQIKQGYAMTESSAMGTASWRLPGVKEHDMTTGVLVGSCAARVVDAVTGQFQPPNQPGEIWLRGPNIMRGYFNNPEATDATVDAEGWLHTGDVGYFDDQNRLHIVDRLKELIKCKGFQVAPAELEALLLSHEEICDSAVVPLADENSGQVPVAFVVQASGSFLTEQDVMNFVSKQVAPFKRLRRVIFVQQIPKSSSGKILRKDLSARAAST